MIARLFMTPGTPDQRHRKAARGFVDIFRAQSKGGRDILMYAPPAVPAWQMLELMDSIEPLPHDCTFRWCSMGIRDDTGKPSPW